MALYLTLRDIYLMKYVTVVVLLLRILSCSCEKLGSSGRYVKREETGSASRLRFTSGSYGFYNASADESYPDTFIKSDMKMGIYVYDAHTNIDYKIDQNNLFSVKSEQIADFIFLRLKFKSNLLKSNIQQDHKINVIAVNRKTKEEIDRSTLYLHVLNINKHAPEFPNAGQVLHKTISENLEIGSKILQVKAIDPDRGRNGELVYFIEPSEVFSVQDFALHPDTGELTLVRHLNIFKRNIYNFRIIAQDKCSRLKCSRSSRPLSVKINIDKALELPDAEKLRGKRQGIFDNKILSIKFTKSVYQHSILEISPPFTPVVRVGIDSDSKTTLSNVVFGFHRGNEKGFFQINSKTGQIYTIKTIDYEKDKIFTLVVIAYHKGLIKARANVVIDILDCNDHSPTFSLQDNITVLEETAIGSIVYRARATDRDTGINSKIVYSIGNMNSTYFDIDVYTGNVRVKKRLDRDGIHPVPRLLFLLIKAMDFGYPIRREGRMILEIRIKKINDNPPLLQFTECSLSVAENAAPGSSVLKIDAVDLDGSSSGVLKFKLTSNIFRIDEKNGDIVVNDLSYAAHEKNLDVVVSDGKFTSRLNIAVNFTPRTDSAKINISCTNSPEYTKAKLYIARRKLNEKSFEIERFKPVTVMQSKIHQPIFLEKPDSTIFLKEDLPVGSFVTKVLAVDKELKCYGLVVYSIVSGSNNEDSNFKIDMLNGTVYLSGKIDREKRAVYNLRIRAGDTDSPSHYTDIDVRIEILDVSDNGPVFTKKNFHVKVREDLSPGSIIATVKATDPDEGPNGDVFYAMVSDLNGLFSLDQYTGVLKLERNLDYEKQKNYIIHIHALDSSSENQKITQATIYVDVTDINDTPPSCFPKIQFKEITDRIPYGAVIGKMSAFDPDSGLGGKVFYEIENKKARILFEIDRDYGILRKNNKSVVIKEKFINITVKVSDSGLPALSTYCYFVLILKYSSSLERPTFQTTEYPVIRNLLKASRTVGLVEVIPQPSETFVYSLVDGNGLGHFSVDSVSGKISSNGDLDVSSCWLTLNVHLKDNPSIYSNIPLLIYGNERSDKPPYFDPSVYRVSVKESKRNAQVVQLLAIDPNIPSSLNNLAYKIISGNDQGHFKVTDTGVVLTTVELDREMQDMYHLNISVYNIYKPRTLSFARVSIRVDDVNDNSPVFITSFPYVSVIEQDPIATDNATFIYHAIATDKDIAKNAALRYSITDGDGKFQINPVTGVITSKSKLAAGESYFITVNVKDSGIPSKSGNNLISVIVYPKPIKGKRTLAFKRKLYTVHLQESNALHGQNYALLPKDLEESNLIFTAQELQGDFLVFNIESGNEENKFTVRFGNGFAVLTLVSPLDREIKKEYDLTIKVTDGIQSDRTMIKVVVDDVNDNPPATSQSCYEAEITENDKPGNVFAQIEAVDPDRVSDGKISYQIIQVSSPQMKDAFTVSPKDGKIRTTKVYDREAENRYILTLLASDRTTSPVLDTAYCVAVNIKDTNDNKPRFTQSLYKTHVDDSLSVGDPLIRLFAVDADTGTNALTTFAITNGNDYGHFIMHSATGIISLAQKFSVSKTTVIRLGVEVSNPGLQQQLFKDHAAVEITVMPEIQGLEFLNKTYRGTVSENQSARPILSVTVPNAKAEYRIISNNDTSNFAIDHISGVISTKGPMDAELNKEYRLTVLASDHVAFHSRINVIVSIEDMNDNSPAFLNDSFTGTIDEGSGRGSEVFDSQNKPLIIRAVDKDSGKNARISYNVVESSAKRYFNIDDNGKLTTAQVLDREKIQKFKFHVQAYDHGTPRLFAFTEVSVRVKDINDKMPEFTQQIYRVQLYTPVYNRTQVVTVQANDGDTNVFGSITYALLNHKDKFSISPKTGDIWVKNAELLTSKAYALQVSSSDGIFTSTCQVQVNLLPITGTSLKFRQDVFHASVPENHKHSKTLIILNVVGYEIGEVILFSIVNPTQGFVMDTRNGVIKTQSGLPFDRERQAYYILIVQARLKSDLSQVAQAMVNVSVEDINDNRPVFTNEPYYQSVHVDAKPGSLLITVHADDADAGSNSDVRYKIAPGNFAIDEKTGAITVKERFVKGKTPGKFILTLYAHDMGDPQLTTRTTVEVPVVNEDMPVFDKNYNFLVPENLVIGATVGKITANGPQGRNVYYSIPKGDQYNQFSLDFNTGELTVIGALDRIAQPIYNLTLQSTDVRSGSWSTTGCTITVEDVNDNRPMFAKPMYFSIVPEDAAKNSLVAIMQATDADEGLNADIRYSLSSLSDTKVPFAISPISGVVSVTGGLDYESTTKYYLRINAVDRGQPALGSSTFLTINIKNVNDNPPVFEHSAYNFIVGEYKSPGQFIGKVHCNDPDSVNGSRIRYVISDSTLVTAEIWTGVVRLNRKPPREAQFKIHCTDEKYTASSVVILTPEITNEHSPVMKSLHQTVNVQENGSPEFITILTAKDPDQSVYGTITYSIDSSLLKERFYINPTVGDIFSKVSLDREKEKDGRIILPVRVSDGGGRFVFCNVIINILDSNDNNPIFEFSSYETTVSSATKIGSAILTVKAIDYDSGKNGEITYSISGLDESVPLQINKQTGILTLTGSPRGKAYQFSIKALDNGYPGRESSTRVRINVIPENQQMLTFKNTGYRIEVAESKPPGYRISLVAATSSDHNADIKYRLVQGNLPSTNATGVFTINKDTGSISLSGQLDYEAVQSYILLVNAYDVKNPDSKAYKVVNVIVGNTNDNSPVFESGEYNISIAENIPVNTMIVQVKAHDADDVSGSSLKYRFVKSADRDIKRLFTVHRKTGVVRVTGKFNTEKRRTYHLHVEVIDGKHSSGKRFIDTTMIRVNLFDTNNSPPVFVSGRRMFTIREDHVVGETVASVLAQDADKNPTIRYYLLSGNDFGNFRIDQTTGVITLASSLDRESIARHTLKIAAYDGVFTTTETVVIVVSDTNDNTPVCSKAFYLVRLTEGTVTSVPIARIEANDADSKDRLTYSLQGDGLSKFIINEKTGDLIPRRNIDREKQPSSEFKVLVTDAGGHMCYSDVFVEVLDKNDNKPIFTQNNYVIPVRENASVSAMLARVQALDADQGPNRRVSYMLSSSGGMFSISAKTGIIILEKTLEKKNQRNYSLMVEAVDDGDPALSSSAKVTIEVLSKTDRPPEFTRASYVFTLSENSKVGSAVGKIETSRRPPNRNALVEYDIVTGDKNTFSLDRTSGVIILLKKLDYEDAKTHTLSISAKYSHLPSLTSVVMVFVNVEDENDNAPVFSKKSYETSVDENIRAGSFVLQVFATDNDEGDNGRVSYSIVRSAQEIPFKIDKMTGEINVANTKPIDREEKDRYVFNVRAYDLGTPPLFTDIAVNISVSDLNDNAPEVDHPNATKIIQEGSDPGQLFVWTAKDRDSPKNGPPFTFTIIEGDKNFSIIEENDFEGTLVATDSIKAAGSKSTHKLVVRVTDNGSPPQSTLCYLTLHIVKASREKPVITEPTVFFIVAENPADLVTVGRIRVTDQDKDDLHQFNIRSGNDDNTFSIGTMDGLIKGRPRQGIYAITVEVSDGKYLASAVIKIIVNAVSEDLYQNSVVITALDISADDFVRDKMKDFANHVRQITSAKIENIAIWAVQTRYQRRKIRALKSTSDTDIAFAVKRTDENGFIKPNVLEKSLKSSKQRLERKTGLSFIISVTDQCAAAPCPVDKKCVSVVKPTTEKKTGSSSDVQAVRFRQGFACLCLDGSKGPDCTGITACSSSPCSHDEKCISLGISYRCEPDVDSDAIQLDGKDYVGYALRERFDSIFKSIAVSFRTEAKEGYLFYAKGHDYCFLEIYEGKVRFKFDFGTGPGIIQIDDIQVNDGRWHDVEVSRNINRATLSLDNGKFQAHGKSKGEHVKIDLQGNEVYFGAGVTTPGKAENGFSGCLRHAKLNGKILPWNGNDSLVSSARSFGVKKSCKDSGACTTTSCPLFSDCINTLSSYSCQCMPGHTGLLCKSRVTCADNPCRNNGICTYFKSNGVIEYRCKCRGPYSGAQCQVYSGQCASNPCRNRGRCVSDSTGYRCKCPTRFSGRNCELDNDPCMSSPCYHGAKCIKTRNDYRCECPPGTKGKRCGFGEYCKLHTCGHGGKCEERLDGPICVCSKGYSGSNCQSDVNECLMKPNPCYGIGTCINTIGGYFCNCTNDSTSKDCHLKGPKAAGQTGVSLMTIVYIAGSAFVALFIVVLIFCYRRKCRRNVEYAQPNNQRAPDVKYPYDCYELNRFPPAIHDAPPEYRQDASDDCAATALYDPSQVAASPSLSDEESTIKKTFSDNESPSKSWPNKMRVDSYYSSSRGSALDVDAKGSVSDVSMTEDRLNGPYHWDYSEVPEDVVNRSKPTRTGSKEGSRMGLTYNLGYEDSPKVTDIAAARRHQNSLDVPVTTTERSPTIKRASGATQGSDGSLMEPYEALNTRLTADDFNNRYSLTLEPETSSLYLQDMLGEEFPAPPSETCPSDIDTCTRPSMSVDDIQYQLRRRRMLPSEISGLDADGFTETSYNSDDEDDNYCERDPLDPDETRKLERDIKILIKDIKTRTEADA